MGTPLAGSDPLWTEKNASHGPCTVCPESVVSSLRLRCDFTSRFSYSSRILLPSPVSRVYDCAGPVFAFGICVLRSFSRHQRDWLRGEVQVQQRAGMPSVAPRRAASCGKRNILGSGPRCFMLLRASFAFSCHSRYYKWAGLARHVRAALAGVTDALRAYVSILAAANAAASASVKFQ